MHHYAIVVLILGMMSVEGYANLKEQFVSAKLINDQSFLYPQCPRFTKHWTSTIFYDSCNPLEGEKSR